LGYEQGGHRCIAYCKLTSKRNAKALELCNASYVAVGHTVLHAVCLWQSDTDTDADPHADAYGYTNADGRTAADDYGDHYDDNDHSASDHHATAE